MATFADYATTAAGNTAASPNGAPEGVAPSAINDIIREEMARSRNYHDANLAQIDIWGTAGGTVDAITLSPAVAITAYAAGQTVRFVSTGANTSTTPTIAVSGLAAKTIQRQAGALAAGDIASGAVVELIYDGTYFQINSTSGNEVRKSAVGNFTAQQYFGEATLTDAATISWNLNTAQTAKVTLAGNRTLANPTNMVAGGTYVLRVIQDGTGSRTLTLGANYKKANGEALVLTTTAAAIDILSFYSDGTYMYLIPNYAFA